jgi:hypothetical protein
VVHLLLHVLGLDDASGRWYLWWSGVGADLGYLAVVAGLYRRHNCEIHRCPRLARHQTNAGHHTCRRRHPDGPLTVEAAHAAHHRAGEP